MNIKQIAVDYVNACKFQYDAERKVGKILHAINPDNTIISLVSSTYSNSYSDLVKTVLGEELFDWLEWWMWETSFGDDDFNFSIDHHQYNTEQLTIDEFVGIVMQEEYK